MKSIRGDRSFREFARDLEINYQVLPQYERGETLPSMKTLQQLAKKEKVNLNWLAFGEGLPYRS